MPGSSSGSSRRQTPGIPAASLPEPATARAEAAIRAFLREQEDGVLNLPGGVDNYPILLTTDSKEAESVATILDEVIPAPGTAEAQALAG
ncbi:hypothetical protein GZ998_05595 [Actinomyces sp. 594]|uniref:hypothetical protein n=1 Tax=Actinomyces sp. 594 TaxID=2057793 RepID=UPI001C59F473|nr:hypothetical protein [Actinomyces sp. 594]MBW3068987.1 hypothetical protein [Actinomyces sp. 594]